MPNIHADASPMKNIPLRLSLRLLAAAILVSHLPAQQPSYHERWRPQYHFTPPTNFMNDPNGWSKVHGGVAQAAGE